MKEYVIKIKWEGPLSIEEVINNKNEGGSVPDDWAGNDYGVYQIYGPHILNKEDALLYVDIAEAILIYRYTPHYNSARLNQDPNLYRYDCIKLIHELKRGRLIPEDKAPNDYRNTADQRL